MKTRKLLILVATMAWSFVAFADDVSFTSTGGTFSGTSAGYVLTSATLTQISGLAGNTYSGDLGTISFSTGLLGSLSNVIVGGPIIPGGSITITGNGLDGLAAGTLFTGTFSQGGVWGYILQSDGTYLYTLTANVTGQDGDGNASGEMTFTINTGHGIFPGYTSASGTDTVSLTAVPEPSEFGLLGIGILGLAGVIWRKLI